ncbi:hypothetical protein DFH11DRAFT_1689322 [Phellopilus nigrolimitatus]|nr:hypothetical protein DFH11DRAFT_1689322 [Phellopilus nigrolimitatus]
MASSVATSSATTTDPAPAEISMRPQAGPLPQKRGEIGFRESMAWTISFPPGASSSSNPNPVSISTDASSMRKPPKRAFFAALDPRRALNRIKLGGVALTTVIRLVIQLALLGGTLGIWAVITMRIGSEKGNGSSSATASEDGATSMGGTASIFVHVIFGLATLGQLLFLERCLFIIRAQRYMYVHRDLPTHARSGSRGSLGMAFAPWNRPPLPTYAAALAQSGVSTGDVEDSAIAVLPPPAYGNTRGSTLLLANFMRNSLHESLGGRDPRPVSRALQRERPVSYRSQDEEWEERCDAERAMRLAETLGRLEDGAAADVVRTVH